MEFHPSRPWQNTGRSRPVEEYIAHRAAGWVVSNLGVEPPNNSVAVSLIDQHYPGGYVDFRAHLIEGMKA